jgi:hypothetical protein
MVVFTRASLAGAQLAGSSSSESFLRIDPRNLLIDPLKEVAVPGQTMADLT